MALQEELPRFYLKCEHLILQAEQIFLDPSGEQAAFCYEPLWQKEPRESLRELMEQRGVSRNQLAKLINVRFEVVNKWFGGQVEKMDLDVLARICYALGCRVEDVLTYRPGEKQ